MRVRSWGLFRFFLSLPEKIAFSRGALGMRRRREPAGDPAVLCFYSLADNDADERGGIACRRLPPKISKLFEAIRPAVADTAIPPREGRVSVDNQCDARFAKFADPRDLPPRGVVVIGLVLRYYNRNCS